MLINGAVVRSENVKDIYHYLRKRPAESWEIKIAFCHMMTAKQVESTIYRMRNRGFIEKNNGAWQIKCLTNNQADDML